MTSFTADLHIHTQCSDGLLTPADIVERAASADLKLIAVTDHDGMGACAELASLAKTKGIYTVPGIEVSAYSERIKFHTLGYGVDEEKFKPFLNRLFESSYIRAEDIIFKLNNIGYDITMDDVNEQRFSLNSPIHGMHIARAMVKKGYVTSTGRFFKKFVAYGKPAFSCIYRPTPEEACEAITSAGGLAVVAHPGRIAMEEEELFKKIKSLKDWGLGGIEACYSTHTNLQTAYYTELAQKLDLVVTGGSDTHNPEGNRKIGVPVFAPSEKLLKRRKIDL